jgi:hypothetical protein
MILWLHNIKLITCQLLTECFSARFLGRIGIVDRLILKQILDKCDVKMYA